MRACLLSPSLSLAFFLFSLPCQSSDSPVHLTAAGQDIGYVDSVLTSSLLDDLILLKPSLITSVPTLPISAYPCDAPIGLIDGHGEERFRVGRIAEYRTRPGTDDDIFSMLVDVVPTEGMSGGPIVDLSCGAVVGIIRGNSYAYGVSLSFPCLLRLISNQDKRGYGFGTPAEHLWSLFELLQRKRAT